MGLKCRIVYENNKPVVYNEDGSRSKLYRDALELVGDEKRALDIWAVASSEDFLKYNGVVNTNDEVSLDEVFEFYNSINAVQGKLSPSEMMEVKSFMRLNDVETSHQLAFKLKKIFRSKTGAIDFNPDEALRSGLFTEKDIEDIDVAAVNELINKIEGTPRFDVAPADYVYKYRDRSRRTIFGIVEIITNAVIEKEVIELLDNLDSKEEFDTKITSLPFIELVEKYQEDEEFAQEFRERFSGIVKIPVVEAVGENLAPASATYATVRNTLRTDVDPLAIESEIDYLTNIPIDIWEENQKNIRNILREVETEMAEYGIDVIGLTKLSMSKPAVLDLLGAVNQMVQSPTEETMKAFSEKYDELFQVSPEKAALRLEPELKGLSIVRIYSDLSDQQLFEQYGLIKIKENTYHKVNKNQNVGTLYEYLYQQMEEGEFSLPQKFVIEKDLRNKEAVLRDIEKYINSRNTGLGFFNEELSLYQVIFNHPAVENPSDTKNRDLSLIKSDEMYLQTEFVSDFYKYILKEKLKNSIAYRDVLSKFRVTDKDLVMVTFTDNNAGFEGLEMYEELVDYFRLKKGDSVAGTYLPQDMYGANTFKGLAINYPQEIRELTEPHILVRNILLTAPNSFEYQRIGNKVYFKVEQDQNNSVYVEIDRPKSNVYNSLYMTLTEYNQSDIDALNKTQNLKNSTQDKTPIAEKRRRAGLDSGFNKRMREDEVLFQVLGEKGVKNLEIEEESTFRMENLQVARRMELENKTPKEIRTATNWERLPSGEWAYEASDVKLKNSYTLFEQMVSGDDVDTTLGEIISDGEVFKAYPQLRNYKAKVTTDEINPKRKASIDASTQTLTINRKEFQEDFYGTFGIGEKPSDYNFSTYGREAIGELLSSTLTHEISHLIQNIEGFPSGGTLASIFFDEKLLDPDGTVNVKKVKDFIKSELDKINNQISNESNLGRIQELEYRKGKLILWDTTPTSTIYAQDYYTRLGGEVLSRNMEARYGMSSEDKRSTLLSETQDVRHEDQVFILRGKVSKMNSEGALDKVFEQNLVEFIRQKGVEVVTDPTEVKRALEGAISPMIVGEVGATESNQLSQTFTQAKDLDRIGKSSEEILKKTGWIKSRGVWKTFDKGLMESVTIKTPMMSVEDTLMDISDVLGESNPVLQMYPQLKDIKIKLYRSSEDGLLGYTKGREIYINLDGGSTIPGSGDYREGFIGKPGYTTERDIASATLTHEISHLIQEIEAFSGGASPNTGTYWLRSRYGYRSNAFYKESLEKDIQNNVFEGVDKQIADLVLEGLVEAEVNNTIVGYPLYKRILGEVEANAVELARINSGLSTNQGIGQILSSYTNLVGIDLENLIDVRDINFLQTPAGEVLGFEKNGVIYLDEEKLNNTTTLHELVHIYQSMIDIKASQGDKQAQAIKNKRAEVFQEFVDGWKEFHKGKVGVGEANVSTMTLPNGNEVSVKKVDVDVVNGFYSPLEKIISEAKQEKLPAKQWLDKFGKGEEAKWTGLTNWLSNQQGSISKQDISDFLKENRVEVSEVVRGGEDIELEKDLFDLRGEYDSNKLKRDELQDSFYEKYGEEYRDSENKELQDYKDIESLIKRNKEIISTFESRGLNIYDYSSTSRNIKLALPTRYSQYQLEGEKENYKEILITLPSKEGKNPLHAKRDVLSKQKREAFEREDYDLANEIDNQISEVTRQLKAENSLNTTGEKSLYKSSHFDEPNILVHLRMNTRIDEQGNKVLFLEEVQSDWGQQGKKEGFKNDDVENKKVSSIKKEISENIKKMSLLESQAVESAILEYTGRKDPTELFKNIKDVKNALEILNLEKTETIVNEYNSVSITNSVLSDKLKGKYGELVVGNSKLTPTAPFVTDTNSWTKLALKVALKEAVKQGATKIAWTTGEQQNERYDLSKQVDKIEVEAVEDVDNLFFVDIKLSNGTTDNLEVENGIIREGNYQGQRLDSVVGKDYADKIMSTPKGENKTLEGADLKVGGKGMKGFYGSPTEGSLGILGNVAKSLFKQEPKITTLGINSQYKFDEFLNEIPESEVNFTTVQHSIDITPELKASVGQGIPMFQIVSDLQNQTGFDLSSPAYAQRPGESDLQWNERLLKEVEAYFTAPKVAEKLENLKKSNPSLWQKIVDFIENLTNYLKKQIGLSDYKGDIMQMTKEGYVDALGVSVLKDKYTPPTLASYLSKSIGEERMLAANLELLQPIPTEEDYDSITDCRI